MKRCVISFATLLMGMLLVSFVVPVLASASPSWSERIPLDAHTTLNSVSCASTSFCVVGEYGGGSVVMYDGSTWSAPIAIDDASRPISSVSCTSASFCVAVDIEGYAMTYNGSTWSEPVQFDSNFAPYDRVSCVSASFCAAVNLKREVWTYNGTSWKGPVGVAGGTTLAISCVSASFCVITDGDGTTHIYNGSTWSQTANIGTSPLESVSCVSASFCATVSSDGYASIYDGSSWHTTANRVDYGNGKEEFEHYLNSVSCVSASFCVAVDGRGYVVFYNGSTWSAPTNIDNGRFMPAVSCVSSSFCVAIDEYDALFYAEGAAPVNTDPPTISGTPKVGQTLTCNSGSWSGDPTPTFTYQWEKDSSEIKGVTNSTYVVQETDEGHTLSCAVTATNMFGHKAANSNGVAVPFRQSEEKPAEESGKGSGSGSKEGSNGPKGGNGQGTGNVGNPTHCIVPKVKGKKFKRALKLIRRHHCSLGNIREVKKPHYPHKHKKRVVRQRPKAGTILPIGGRVSLVVG